MSRLVFAVATEPFPLAPILADMRVIASGEHALHERNRLGRKVIPEGDGWGIAWRRGLMEPFQVRRSVTSFVKDDAVSKLEGESAQVLLLHVRRRTPGISINIENTHPFDRDLSNVPVPAPDDDLDALAESPPPAVRGRWFFAHLGAVADPLAHVGRMRPFGQTDSERLFLDLLSELPAERPDQAPYLFNRFNSLRDYTSLTSVLLGPEVAHVMAYVRRDPLYHALHRLHAPDRLVVASEPLQCLGDETQWQPIPSSTIFSVGLNAPGEVEPYTVEVDWVPDFAR